MFQSWVQRRLLQGWLIPNKYRCEAAALCPKIRCLPLIQARRNQLHLAVVCVIAEIRFQTVQLSIDGNLSRAWRYNHLGHVARISYLVPDPPCDLITAVRRPAAITGYGLEEPFIALVP